ncbi:DNA replication factor C, large subunit [Sodiomyces alkalinus F11]|uniref:Replication factor C subunit 1 n=1 Tax=Sodiomyces alkalinus (strain CBS 110278 / VKM F-3762 / F11) TaxID=1314773 RepID=A0A3N2Q975_SODAK|nr:DNA replication factor C, large subunit [Sodiomyces alkalinus F11]ROT43276.1 DNA replication factor C, large subunit [Sodiomyces alkalinus F11]
MPDIRSFFGPKNGASAPKAVPKKKPEEPTKGRRSRKVIEDSDDDDAIIEQKAPKPAPKRAKKEESDGVEITASEYFASSKAGKGPKAPTSPKPDAKTQVRKEAVIRSSPRNKLTTKAPEAGSNGNGHALTSKKRTTTSYKSHDLDDDAAYKDDDAEDDGDIFAADAKGRNKRKNGDYVDDESEDEDLPKPKRIASRSNKAAATTPVQDQPAPKPRKRKSPERELDESEEEKPKKKQTPAKRAPRTKKADEAEDASYQAILDDIPTVRPPTPPPKDPNAKFDWRAAKSGGHAAAPPSNPAGADIPEGEEECLTGLTFVFTGVLQTIGREEGQALVKRYGGKITTAPSSKTSYVVLGDDAGPSKLKKIKDFGIKTIDEHGLFELIKRLPAYGGSGKGAEKAREKKKKEEEKMKQEALEMEQEEKARRAEAEKAAKKAAAARGVTGAAAAPAAPPAQLWTSKYAPTQLSHICGNKVQVEKIQNWLRNWPKSKKYNFQKRGADGMGGARAIIISGPPGIGKTTAAHLAAKLEGYDVLETNASDARSKRLVEEGVSDVMNNTSLLGFFAGEGKKADAGKKNIVLVMDEVDGMSAGDRGGVGALAKFCKKTEVPLILICNERRLPKMKPFDFVTFDVPFRRPTVEQVRSRIMTICHREGLKMPPNVVDALIEGSNKDIRQIINMVSTAKLDQTAMNFEQGQAMTKAWEKHVIIKPWDICQKLLGGGMFSPASKARLNDKIELYFNDHEFSYLMIQENYLRTKPMALNNKGYSPREQRVKALELFDCAAESISDGDLVDRMIHGPQQQWSLMPAHAVFSTVRPASFISGQLMGTNFTSWLGNNSKTGKLGRFVREIHSHMRLKSSGDAMEIRQQYLPVLWYQLVQRLAVEGKDSINEVIELMDSYYLTRDDFDALKELGLGPQAEEKVDIETQTKAAFTRIYNSMPHPVPFMKASNVLAPKKAAKEAPDLEEAIEEEDEGELEAADVVEDDELDLKNDKYVKQPKKKAARATKKKAKANDSDDEDSGPKTKKAPSKGSTAKGRGRK